MSHYRANVQDGPVADSDTGPPDDQQRGHPVRTVLAFTLAMGVLYLGTIWLLQPTINDRVLLLGVFLIATGGAVVLNAITVEATNRPSRKRV